MPRNYRYIFAGESISLKRHKKSWILCGIRSRVIFGLGSWVITESGGPRCAALSLLHTILTNHSDSVRESQQFSHTFPCVSFLRVVPYSGGPSREKGYAGGVSSALSLVWGVIGAHGHSVNSIRCKHRIRLSNLCFCDGHANIMITVHSSFTEMVKHYRNGYHSQHIL